MMKRSFYLGVGVVSVLSLIMLWVIGCSGTATSAPQSKQAVATPTTSASQALPSTTSGQQLYQTNCASCHGANGAGGKKMGDTSAADLRRSKMEDMYHGDTALTRRAILDGKDEDGETIDEVMPRWRGKLSDQQADDIIAYLKTLQ